MAFGIGKKTSYVLKLRYLDPAYQFLQPQATPYRPKQTQWVWMDLTKNGGTPSESRGTPCNFWWGKRGKHDPAWDLAEPHYQTPPTGPFHPYLLWTQSSHAFWVKSSTKALTTWWNSTQASHLAFHFHIRNHLETIWGALTIFALYPHTIVLLEGQCLMRAGHTPRLNSRDLIAVYAPQHRNSWSTSAKLPNTWRQGPQSGKGTS